MQYAAIPLLFKNHSRGDDILKYVFRFKNKQYISLSREYEVSAASSAKFTIA